MVNTGPRGRPMASPNTHDVVALLTVVSDGVGLSQGTSTRGCLTARNGGPHKNEKAKARRRRQRGTGS